MAITHLVVHDTSREDGTAHVDSSLDSLLRQLVGSDAAAVRAEPASDHPWKKSGDLLVTFTRGRAGSPCLYQAFVSFDKTPDASGVPVYASFGGASLRPRLRCSSLDYLDGVQLLARFHVDLLAAVREQHTNPGGHVDFHRITFHPQSFDWASKLARFAAYFNPDSGRYADVVKSLLSAVQPTSLIHGDAWRGNIVGDDASSRVRCPPPELYQSSVFRKEEPFVGHVIDVRDIFWGDVTDDVSRYVVNRLVDPTSDTPPAPYAEDLAISYYIVKYNQYCVERGAEDAAITDVPRFFERYELSKKREIIRQLGKKMDNERDCTLSPDKEHCRREMRNLVYETIKMNDTHFISALLSPPSSLLTYIGLDVL